MRQLAQQLHAALLARMPVADPPPDLRLLWQAARMIDTAAGCLDWPGLAEVRDRYGADEQQAILTALIVEILLTGTPAGVGPIHPGDEVTVAMERVGALSNAVEQASR